MSSLSQGYIRRSEELCRSFRPMRSELETHTLIGSNETDLFLLEGWMVMSFPFTNESPFVGVFIVREGPPFL